jgi:hypothetical protein
MSNDELIERVNTDLEIDEHLLMQERGWKMQAIGMYLILAIVLTAALGLYGDGPISKRTIENIATVEYQRFYRFQSRMALKVQMDNTNNPKGLAVMFPTKYLRHFQVDSVLPEPEKTIINGDQIQYQFNGKGNIMITFYLIPQRIGTIDGSMEVNNNRFVVNHFIFP